MPAARSASLNSVLRDLPSVDELLRTAAGASVLAEAGEAHTLLLVRRTIEGLRGELLDGSRGEIDKTDALAICAARLGDAWAREISSGVRRVINATGVVIHTNLGRAPLSHNARRAVAGAAGYCTLEYDLSEGKRGRRGERAERMLTELTGAEDTLIVNNCAAAALFVLTAFAAGGEVVISRGEMVEIGGDFRVPDVLAQSGATLGEVGTTNRTKLKDYEAAINGQTRMILRVHPSNYRIVGFTATPSLSDLADLAHRHQIILYEDIGSGAVIDLAAAGLEDEPVVSRSITAGVDVVTFSGDKLLGGPQCGIIAGRRELIASLREHPLYRVLRVDKLIYAALEATLEAFQRGTAFDEVPVLQMLSKTPERLAERAQSFIERLRKLTDRLEISLVEGKSAVGGGAAPGVELATTLITVASIDLTTAEIEKRLRQNKPAVIARIADDRVVIDLRTVADDDEQELLDALANLST